MMEINSTTDIAASAETVWGVLTDLREFHTWNPFIRDARGTPEVGGSVRMQVLSSQGIPLVFHAKVLARAENRELRWTGHVLAPWLARGDHAFTIEPLDAGHVRFVQRETFSGLLPWLARRLLARETRRGFRAMNRALGARAELAS